MSPIHGDPGAVSRVRRKGGMKAEEPLGTDSHRTISKNSSGCRLLIGHKKCFVLLCSIGEHISWVLFICSYTTAIVSPHLPGSLTKLVRARENFIFYFPNQKQRNYRWVEKTFGMYQHEQLNLPWDKSFPSWRFRADAEPHQCPVTHTLVSADVSVASFSLLRCSLSSGQHCIGWRSISVSYLTIRLTIQTALFLPLFLGLLSVCTCMTVHVHVYYSVIVHL